MRSTGSTDRLVLSNRLLWLTFSARTGSLLQVEDRRTACRHLAEPSFARLFRVVRPSSTWLARFADSQDSELRRRTAGFTTRGTFRDRVGLALDGCTGYLFETADGIGVTLAETAGSRTAVRAVIDPVRLGRRAISGGDLYGLDGGTTRAAGRLSGGRVRLARMMKPFEAAVWFVPCAPAASH
jgi:hypothetical protein